MAADGGAVLYVGRAVGLVFEPVFRGFGVLGRRVPFLVRVAAAMKDATAGSPASSECPPATEAP